ncbi:hypothetical protein [Saccharicrinis sp. GN24d3]|uniref:hypothetical protein n=1 Tax=Saccharicrinis sp. GN24d3 TaxID=3458416 RepID=UPI004036A57B
MINTVRKIIVIVLITGYLLISYFIYQNTDIKYEQKIPFTFWVIFLAIFLLSLLLAQKKPKGIYPMLAMLLLLMVQVLVFLIPEVHNFACQLFN